MLSNRYTIFISPPNAGKSRQLFLHKSLLYGAVLLLLDGDHAFMLLRNLMQPVPGTPAEAGLDHVWIGAAGRAILLDRPWPAVTSPSEPTAVADLAVAIAGAERPAFLVGSDAYWDGAEGPLAEAATEMPLPPMPIRQTESKSVQPSWLNEP